MKRLTFLVFSFLFSFEIHSSPLGPIPIFESILANPAYHDEISGVFPASTYCSTSFINPDAAFTMLGDSRVALFLNHNAFYDPFRTGLIADRIYNARLNADDPLSLLVLNQQAPALSGGRVFGQGFPGKTIQNMVSTIQYCHKKPYAGWYRTVGPTVLHMGGNDINSGMKSLEIQEGQFWTYIWLIQLLTDPWHFLLNVFTGKAQNNVDIWWMWQMEALARKTAYDVGAVAYSLAKDNVQPVMIVLPAVSWSNDTPNNLPQIPNPKRMIRQLTVFARFNAILIQEIGGLLLPYTVGSHPMISFEDMVQLSWDPSNYMLDLVHMNDTGSNRWGSQIAKTMVLKGWFPVNPGVTLSADNAAKIDEKARQLGVNDVDILSSPMQGASTYYYKDFTFYLLWPLGPYQVRIYARDADPVAYFIPGDILEVYLANGEVFGPLGFPKSDPIVTGLFGLDRLTRFENGCIYKWGVGYPEVTCP